MKLSPALAFLPVVWLAACADSGGSSSSGRAKGISSTQDVASTEQNKGFRVKTGDMFDDDSDKIRAKFGTMQKSYDPSAKNKVAAGFDKQDANFSNKQFNAKPFQKKSFWGDREYAKKVYGGNTDGSRFMKESGIADKSARESGEAAHDADRQFAVHDNAFSGKSANEASKSFGTKSDSQVDYRRKVGNAFSDPDVMDWREQRSLNVQSTKSLLHGN